LYKLSNKPVNGPKVQLEPSYFGVSGTLFYTEKHKSQSSLVSIPLPKTQSNYTVLRSPHIDKKSRDQFRRSVHKQLIIISTEIKRIREKLFNLKFHEMPGVQMKVVFKTKTRLVLEKESNRSHCANALTRCLQA
jgi:small subunit ribosomal protein S10